MGIDMEQALENLDGDRDILLDTVEVFLSEYPNMIREINEAFDAGDSSVLERTAHTFKGLAGNFYADQAVEAALGLEKVAAAGNSSDTEEALKALIKELNVLEQALVKFTEEG